MAGLSKLLGVLGGIEVGRDLVSGTGSGSETEENVLDAAQVSPVAPAVPPPVPPSAEPEATGEVGSSSFVGEAGKFLGKKFLEGAFPQVYGAGEDAKSVREYLKQEREELLRERDDSEKRDAQYRRDVEQLRYGLDTTNSILKNNTDLLKQGLNLQNRSVALLTDILHATRHGGGVLEELLMGAAGASLLGKGGGAKGASMLADRGTLGALKVLAPLLGKLALRALAVAATAKVAGAAVLPKEKEPNVVVPRKRSGAQSAPDTKPKIEHESFEETPTEPKIKFRAEKMTFRADRMVFGGMEGESTSSSPTSAGTIQRASFGGANAVNVPSTRSFLGGAPSSVHTPVFTGGAPSSVRTPAFSGGAPRGAATSAFPGSGSAVSRDKEYGDLPKSRGNSRKVAEDYLGRPMSDPEWDSLRRATVAESGGNAREDSMVMASILNRARDAKDSVVDELNKPNQFQSVTGTKYDHSPSKTYQHPGEKRLGQVDQSVESYLGQVSHRQRDFTAAGAGAYGPGTDIGYRDRMLNRGGSVVGGSVFNTESPTRVPGTAQAVQPAPSVQAPSAPLHDRPPVRRQVPASPAKPKQNISDSVSVMNVGVKAPGLSPNYYSYLYPHLYGDRASMSPETNARTA